MAKQLHMGVRHQACSKSFKLPEQLLALLWLLRYTIHDSESFDRLCHFFYPDKLKAVEVQVEQEIFDPLWIVHYIIYPIMSIEYFLFDKKDSKTFDIYKKFYCKHQQYTHSRTKESIIYSLASIFIEILLENGENPDMITSNKNTQDISQYLRKSESFSSRQHYTHYSFKLCLILLKTTLNYITTSFSKISLKRKIFPRKENGLKLQLGKTLSSYWQ